MAVLSDTGLSAGHLAVARGSEALQSAAAGQRRPGVRPC
ncbi:hypothetical protein Y09_1895 [Brachybacterium sp. SW0106-09]|nr:hypothetical protein Y09_1895 [Brachybacterium sp. SW0106-09]